jgi:hypothetical protein
MGAFQPVPDAPPAPIPQPGLAPTGPPKPPVKGILAVVFSGVFIVIFGLAAMTEGRVDLPPFLGFLMLAMPVASLILGILSMADGRRNNDQRARTLGLIAVIVSSLLIGLAVVAIIVALIVFALCAAACSNAECATTAAMPLTARGKRKPGHSRLDHWLAHHPPGAAYDAHVYRVAGLRFCIGCFTSLPVFGASYILLSLVGPLGVGTLGLMMVGLVIASPQALSAFGWVQSKAAKILVKTALGIGTAVYLTGVEAAAWPQALKVAAVLAPSVLLAWGAAIRGQRMANDGAFAKPLVE